MSFTNSNEGIVTNSMHVEQRIVHQQHTSQRNFKIFSTKVAIFPTETGLRVIASLSHPHSARPDC